MLYFKMNLSKKYLHTSGTLYAHIRHTAGTSFWYEFSKNHRCAFCVPHVCRSSGDVLSIKNQKVQTISFRMPCRTSKSDIPSALWLSYKIGKKSWFWWEFDVFDRGVEKTLILPPPWTFFWWGTNKCSVYLKIFLRELDYICSSHVKTFEIWQHFY